MHTTPNGSVMPDENDIHTDVMGELKEMRHTQYNSGGGSGGTGLENVERDKLKELNAELLEALEDLVFQIENGDGCAQCSVEKADAVIAKAKGGAS